ncbi:MAG: hypothetical protein ACLR1T_00075 [Evtepia gabavorous]
MSLLMAMCLMATMVPAAFAADTDQPDTITLPNGEVREIPTVEFPDAPATLAEIDSSEVVTIDSVSKFLRSISSLRTGIPVKLSRLLRIWTLPIVPRLRSGTVTLSIFTGI